jgi:uncharacterized protein (TIGR02271 family)
VNELIVDTAAMKVRYIEIDPNDTAADTGNPVYVSIAEVDLDPSAERVVIRGSSLSELRTAASEAVGRGLGVRRASSSQASTGDQTRLTRSEEEVAFGKRAVQAGEVRVGKHVETERVRESVPVSREEVHIERRPVEPGRSGEIRASAGEIRVPIVEEEVVAEKRAVVKEELVISKERMQDEKVVETEVRKERFDIHDDRGTRDASGRRRTGGE